MIVTKRVTWANVPVSRPLSARSTPSMEGEGFDRGRSLEASLFGGDTESGDGESDSIKWRGGRDGDVRGRRYRKRAVSTTSRAGSSVHSGCFFYPKGQGSSSRGLADAPAVSDSFKYGRDQQFAELRAGEAKRLAEYIPGLQRATTFKGRTRRAEERRLQNIAQIGLVSVEDVLDIALHVEEITLEQALQVDIEASVERPTTQEEVRRSPFRMAFEHSQ